MATAAVATSHFRSGDRESGQSYLLAGVLSIKLWFMQIMRVQKLVCHSHRMAKGAEEGLETGPRLLWPCCRTEQAAWGNM